jgi:hypothetical protein
MKLDSQGRPDPAWDPDPKTFGGESHDGGSSVRQTSDGGYIFAGYTDSLDVGLNDVFVIKLDSAGNLDPA